MTPDQSGDPNDGPIEEADLHGYVDGRLAPARHALVARHLDAHPALRQRVQDWADQAAALRDALRRDDRIEQQAILARLTQARSRGWSRMAVAAGIAVALAVGGAGGWFSRGAGSQPEIARLGTEAATAYRIFANDPSRAVEISADNRAELVAWMAEKLGRRVALPDLAPRGYRLLGGRVLSALYGPAAMLVYADAANNRITVYVQPMRIGAPADMRPMEAQAVDGYAWIDRQLGYSVMSEGDRKLLHAVADQVREDARS